MTNTNTCQIRRVSFTQFAAIPNPQKSKFIKVLDLKHHKTCIVKSN